MRLKDKCILVTGSATGIGQAMARRFVAEGARVVIHGIEQGAAETIAASIGSGAAGAFACDLALPESAPALIEFAVKVFGGRLSGLVNNAATIPRTNLFTTDAAMFDRCMAVNVRAPMLLIKAAFAYLKESKGSVLNIGSVNAYCGESNLLPYSLSKGALMVLTRNLADAHGIDGVRFNQINPGWVHSAAEDALQKRIRKDEHWVEHLPRVFAPAGRILKPEEIAALAVYWMSDESQIVSGTVMECEQFPVIGRNPAKEL
jgi:NAD(P)-dependent dehydrogenase (short-subunit alcohol dehydrogenase family)